VESVQVIPERAIRRKDGKCSMCGSNVEKVVIIPVSVAEAADAVIDEYKLALRVCDYIVNSGPYNDKEIEGIALQLTMPPTAHDAYEAVRDG